MANYYYKKSTQSNQHRNKVDYSNIGNQSHFPAQNWNYAAGFGSNMENPPSWRNYASVRDDQARYQYNPAARYPNRKQHENVSRIYYNRNAFCNSNNNNNDNFSNFGNFNNNNNNQNAYKYRDKYYNSNNNGNGNNNGNYPHRNEKYHSDSSYDGNYYPFIDKKFAANIKNKSNLLSSNGNMNGNNSQRFDGYPDDTASSRNIDGYTFE